MFFNKIKSVFISWLRISYYSKTKWFLQQFEYFKLDFVPCYPINTRNSNLYVMCIDIAKPDPVLSKLKA